MEGECDIVLYQLIFKSIFKHLLQTPLSISEGYSYPPGHLTHSFQIFVTLIFELKMVSSYEDSPGGRDIVHTYLCMKLCLW